ncbi:GNAT family N-acetyltransferase [Archangium sp. Cb G35]|uniref:GNAT family N-acetyltransferase n=1 Tax=Archangium sp. Cb G35 TaxID=1920190 RepID=UPI000937AB99|nr:GNAT family N-acetyltransferase [Archangium sp. Cb G35]OJT26729.1 GNAT family N-acetyltransferase [Archangium sp. Cb G35]
MSTELNLRPIEPRDDAAVAAVIRQVMPEFGASGPGFAIHDPEVNGMSAAYARPGCAYWVVEDETGRVLGGGGIAPLDGGDPSVCELRKMYFLPEVRGRGVGEQLLGQCLAFARAAGYRTCYLETLAAMTQAQKLYQRLGFQPLRAPMGATGHFGCDRWYALELR